MSGIRGFRDLDPQNQRNMPNNPNERQLLGDPEVGLRQFPILGYGFQLGTPQECRKQTFWQMLTYIFCPFFTVVSFIFAITIIDMIMFLVSVAYDFDSDSFLEPTEDSLDTLGAKNPQKMQQDYQLWRWFTPMLLHANLTHIAFNLIMQLILGFRLQPTVGFTRTAGVYILSAFGGVLFSSLVSPTTLAVGASTAIFGLTAAMMAWIIMNWSALEADPYRTVTLIWLILLLVLNLILGFASTLVDSWGHFGGMITGFALGWALFEYVDPPTQKDKVWKFTMAGLLGFYYIGGLVLFYTAVDTE